jgi:hypothetical protein
MYIVSFKFILSVLWPRFGFHIGTIFVIMWYYNVVEASLKTGPVLAPET